MWNNIVKKANQDFDLIRSSSGFLLVEELSVKIKQSLPSKVKLKFLSVKIKQSLPSKVKLKFLYPASKISSNLAAALSALGTSVVDSAFDDKWKLEVEEKVLNIANKGVGMVKMLVKLYALIWKEECVPMKWREGLTYN